MSDTPPNLMAAQELAKYGFRVKPLHSVRSRNGVVFCTCENLASKKKGQGVCRHPGKHPLTKYASRTEGQIHQQWTRWPIANIGIALDENWVVIDIDPRNGGTESWEKLLEDHDLIELNSPIEVATGGGGRHLYYRAPKGVSFRSNLDSVGYSGIDILYEKKITIAPPSRHKSGKLYRWLENSAPWQVAEVPELPAWLLEVITKPNTPTKETKPKRSRTTTTPREPLDPSQLPERLRIASEAMGYIGMAPRDNWLDTAMGRGNKVTAGWL